MRLLNIAAFKKLHDKTEHILLAYEIDYWGETPNGLDEYCACKTQLDTAFSKLISEINRPDGSLFNWIVMNGKSDPDNPVQVFWPPPLLASSVT